MIKSVTVTVRGVEFEVTGEYTPYRPSVIRQDPDACCDAEGGTFDTENIQACGVDMYDLLAGDVLQEIREAAADEAAKGE